MNLHPAGNEFSNFQSMAFIFAYEQDLFALWLTLNWLRLLKFLRQHNYDIIPKLVQNSTIQRTFNTIYYGHFVILYRICVRAYHFLHRLDICFVLPHRFWIGPSRIQRLWNLFVSSLFQNLLIVQNVIVPVPFRKLGLPNVVQFEQSVWTNSFHDLHRLHKFGASCKFRTLALSNYLELVDWCARRGLRRSSRS